MASILSELKTWLKTKSAVTDLVGSGNDARIYIGTLKDSITTQAITIQGFGVRAYHHLGGDTGVRQRRVEVTCWAGNGAAESEADTLMSAVDDELCPSGSILRTTMGSTEVKSVIGEEDENDDRDPPTLGSAQYRFWKSRDYIITYVRG